MLSFARKYYHSVQQTQFDFSKFPHAAQQNQLKKARHFYTVPPSMGQTTESHYFLYDASQHGMSNQYKAVKMS